MPYSRHYRLRPSALNSLKRTVSQRHPMLNSRYQRPYHARRKASRRLLISCWMIGHLLRVDSRLRSGIALLIAGLIFVAALQILTLAAIFGTRWSTPIGMTEKLDPQAHSTLPAPVLSSPTTLKALAGENVPFPLALDGTDTVPARSIISIKGLPQASTLASGRPYGETEWNFRPDEIGDVHLAVPNAVDRDTKLMIQLAEPTRRVLAHATTLLNVTANIPVYAVKTQLIQGDHWDHSSPELMQERQGKAGNLDAAIASAAQDTVLLPTKHPAMTASDEVDTSWIKSS